MKLGYVKELMKCTVHMALGLAVCVMQLPLTLPRTVGNF
jgi:hypothetical protein